MKMIDVKKLFIFSVCITILYAGCGSKDSGSDNSSAEEDIVTVNEATPQGVSLTCDVPELEFKTIETPSGDFNRIKSANSSVTLYGGGIGGYSKPEVPATVFFLAFPYGATSQDVVIDVTPVGGKLKNDLRLYPVQKPKHDLIDADDDESFSYDETTYLASSTLVKNIKLSKVDGIDDANIWRIAVNLMDYDSKLEQGTLYDKIDINVSFTGDTDCYSVKRVAVDPNNMPYPIDSVDQWIEEEKSSSKKIDVKNEAILLDETHQETNKASVTIEGSRFIIITDAEFIDAANRLAAHKESIGISTSVIVADAVPGGDLTDETLRDFLADCYDSWAVQPRWVLLMGDVEFIPTHPDSQDNSHDGVPNSGDMYYGQIHGDAMELPVFGIGRFPVDTEEQADIIVDKIIAYETTPPPMLVFEGSFYSKLTFAAEFQDVDKDHPVADGYDVRWFAETSEHIRDYMTDLYFNVERIYKASSEHDPLYWEDGTPIPSYLKRPMFAWDGDTADIINAVNNGTSILYHRDHGAYWGWGTPSFVTYDLSSITITDNQYPAVYSINCASGYFDNETQRLYGTNSSTVTWSEHFIRNEHGAIGIVCDTRCSDTILNNSFAKGLFDATWPSYLHYGSDTSIRKLGDILNHAKGYVAACDFEELDIRQEIIIYNLLGDPTVEVKSEPPIVIEAGVSSWATRSSLVMNLRIPDPSDLAALRTPIIAVAVEPVTETVVGRTLLRSEEIKSSNTVPIAINEQRLGNYNKVNIYFSGSEVERATVPAQF